MDNSNAMIMKRCPKCNGTVFIVRKIKNYRVNVYYNLTANQDQFNALQEEQEQFDQTLYCTNCQYSGTIDTLTTNVACKVCGKTLDPETASKYGNMCPECAAKFNDLANLSKEDLAVMLLSQQAHAIGPKEEQPTQPLPINEEQLPPRKRGRKPGSKKVVQQPAEENVETSEPEVSQEDDTEEVTVSEAPTIPEDISSIHHGSEDVG